MMKHTLYIRLNLLVRSLIPVYLGFALAFGDGIDRWTSALFIGLGVMVTQWLLMGSQMDDLRRSSRSFFQRVLTFLVYGPVLLVGTYYIQSNEWDYAVLLSSFSVGFMSLAIGEFCQKLLQEEEEFPGCGDRYFLDLLGLALLPGLLYLLIHDHMYILAISFLTVPAFVTSRSMFRRNVPVSALWTHALIVVSFTAILSLSWVF